MKNIVNVVICYYNSAEIIQYAKHMESLQESDQIMLVIVINGASDGDFRELNTLHERLSLDFFIVTPEKNLGYMNGLTYGYKQYISKYGAAPRFVIMSNTDIAYEDKQFYSKLLRQNYAEDVWCIGPSVYVKELDTYDNPVAYRRRTIREIYKLILKFQIPVFREFYVRAAKIKGKFIKKPKQHSAFVYEVHGCFFILRGEGIDNICREVYGPLMYSEETFIAELIYQNGKKIYYDSTLEIIHLEHSVTKHINLRKHADYLQESMQWIKKKFY